MDSHIAWPYQITDHHISYLAVSLMDSFTPRCTSLGLQKQAVPPSSENPVEKLIKTKKFIGQSPLYWWKNIHQALNLIYYLP